jgi:AAA+ superfamily predicted ATPase
MMAWTDWFRRRRQALPQPVQEPALPVVTPVAREAPSEEPPAASAEPAAAAVELPTGPYATSDEHLSDELCRVDQLVRAQTVRWRLTIGASKSHDLWGMLHVTDAEVAAYLASAFSISPHGSGVAPPAADEYVAAADRLGAAIKQRRAKTPEGVLLRAEELWCRFSLSAEERDAVLLSLLPELDGRYRRLFGYLQDDASRTQPTVELVRQILYPASGKALGRLSFDGASALLGNELLVLDEDVQRGEPLSMRSIHIDDRIAAYLIGGDAIDARLSPFASLPVPGVAWDALTDDAQRIERLRALAVWWAGKDRGSSPSAVLFLHGPNGSGRLTAARAFCTAASSPLLVADAEEAVHSMLGWARAVKLTYREAVLRGAAVYWRNCDVLLERDQPPQRWNHLMASAEAFAGLSFVAARTPWDPAGRFRAVPFLRVDFAMPGYDLRRRIWERALPEAEAFAEPAPNRDALAAQLANGFQLTAGQVADAVASALAHAATRNPSAPALTVDDLYEGCRRQSGQRLIALARRVEPRTDLTFDDLVLPEANRRQLVELRTRIRNRNRVYTGLGLERRLSLGKGLIALFTGSSGTGKTMAAELLAREQGVDLYKIDLSAVVSKYVGETEKNLSRVFAEAEDSNAIIFFDEADALFGKRGEVKEAQDRWANMEVNYLLQRVEEYAGVVILASNLRQNIDEAFMRRIHVIVEFPFPDVEGRLRIWLGMFPPSIGRPSDQDIRALASRFRLAGGAIKNIVVDAAFRALSDAGDDEPTITQRHLVLAAAREYQKLGKPLTKSEFGEEFYCWLEESIL